MRSHERVGWQEPLPEMHIRLVLRNAFGRDAVVELDYPAHPGHALCPHLERLVLAELPRHGIAVVGG
jgi:hypothetical protein